jgi:hypothetical protein
MIINNNASLRQLVYASTLVVWALMTNRSGSIVGFPLPLDGFGETSKSSLLCSAVEQAPLSECHYYGNILTVPQSHLDAPSPHPLVKIMHSTVHSHGESSPPINPEGTIKEKAFVRETGDRARKPFDKMPTNAKN